MKTILILGGSFAGVSLAHRVLKQASKAGLSVKIVLVAPNTHLYWNVAAPRAIVPGQFTDDQVFQPIAAGFKQYTAKQFEFVLGSAKNIDFAARKVEITLSSENQKTTTLDYNFLVLATGSSNKGNDIVKLPFKGLGSTEATKNALHEFQAEVKKAKTIVIAGGGPSGVETAGELAFEYGKQKKIILLTSAEKILETAPPSVTKTAMGILGNLNVDVKLKTKVVHSSRMTQDGANKIELSLSDDSTITADLYIPLYGLIPNSSYVPEIYLDSNGFVKVDEYLQLKGLDQHVWAIGDVSDMGPPQFLHVDKQSTHLAKNILLILRNQPPLSYKNNTRAMGVQIGKKAGTGHFNTMKLPGFVVTMLRKNLFTERLPSMVDGSAF
ncbi:putative apoptosis-inducing factor [Talaromyces proteolyticus]|uniref:Apoptosis-inducing factor n=1 Tax=Talaromyces proteolyticus TaxID=1131652 RepID=A0AAD4Q1Z9_9EURO|nr:putative apoptosis-inducing factor [Talaromyces proteolyticus]KAH8699088.1 putative apoptosis-inducing factor [Talaromyces proteolyticus]